MGLISSNAVSIKFNNKSFEFQIIFRYSPLYSRPLKDHSAAKGCPEFVVEFNSYSIPGEESNVSYLSLAGSGPCVIVLPAVELLQCLQLLLLSQELQCAITQIGCWWSSSFALMGQWYAVMGLVGH